MKANVVIVTLLLLLLRSPSFAHVTTSLEQQLLTRSTRHGSGRRFKCDPFYRYLYGICGCWPFPTYPSPHNPCLPTPSSSPRTNPPPLVPSPPPSLPSPPPSPPLVPSPPPPPFVIPPSLIIPPPLVSAPPFPDVPEAPIFPWLSPPDVFTHTLPHSPNIVFSPPDFPSSGSTQAPPLVPELLPPPITSTTPALDSFVPVQPSPLPLWLPPLQLPPPSYSPPLKN